MPEVPVKLYIDKLLRDNRSLAKRLALLQGPAKNHALRMMADSVEAAGRTLEDPNHQRYKDVVNKIINKKLFDDQLSETPLSGGHVRGPFAEVVKR